jgi:hypothetical protein
MRKQVFSPSALSAGFSAAIEDAEAGSIAPAL